MSIVGLVLGRRLANREAVSRKIGTLEGVSAMGLDALGSTAYGPEAALAILAPLGAAGLHHFGWVMVPIVVLLAILFASYWQTIRAYPNAGGSYVVARENLGTQASLLAAAALMIDYVLNVAVGISAGVAALVSVVPALHAHILPLCLCVLLLLTLINLRGTLDSGRVLAFPTYLFIASFACILVRGLYATSAAAGNPQPLVAPPEAIEGSQPVMLWLLLRAFASGCTAMTGVEAVSNGVGAFREPRVRYAHRTLAVIVVTLGAFIGCIAWLVPAYRVAAMDQETAGYQTVLSQLAGAIVGHGVLYHVALSALLCVLVLSANTSFVGFPGLCRSVADDGFLPKTFALAGRRLVYSIGMLYLAACAGLLLFAFGGITNSLIPLFAIGAFLSFTISQVAMVMHWRHMLATQTQLRARRMAYLSINAIGACATAVCLVVIVTTKFSEGAWITVAAVPLVLALLRTVRRYYDTLEHQTHALPPMDFSGLAPPIVLVAIEDLNGLAMKGIALGLSLSPDVLAVHLTHLRGPDCEEHERKLRARWKRHVEAPAQAAGLTAPRLMILPAQRRTIHEPVLRLVEKTSREFPQRRIAVLIPEVVKTRWYQQILHEHQARRLRLKLLEHAGPRLTVVSVPWHLEER